MKSSPKTKQVSLREIFLGLQTEMTAKLMAARKVIHHPGTKGDVGESSWLALFKTYLPARYSAARAIVVDSDGSTSHAIDIVVFDRHFSPFLLHSDGAIYIPAESVYAVFEVKQELNSDTIAYAGKKAESVRRLRRTSATIVHAGGKFRPVKPKEVIAGILSLDSKWSSPAALRKSLHKLSGHRSLNLGCSLNWGAFSCEYGPRKKWHLELFRREVALMAFFLSFLDTLQKTGSVPAMDIRAYRRNL